MLKSKRKTVSLEEYDLHQARAAVLLPMAISIELMISLGLIVGIITGAAGAPLASVAMLAFTLFGLWMAWNIYCYVTLLRRLKLSLHRQYRETARVQRLLEREPTHINLQQSEQAQQWQRWQ